MACRKQAAVLQRWAPPLLLPSWLGVGCHSTWSVSWALKGEKKDETSLDQVYLVLGKTFLK